MLQWFSKSSLVRTASALALLGVVSAPAPADRHANRSHGTLAGAKASQKKRGSVPARLAKKSPDPASRVDLRSVASVEKRLKFLREMAWRSHLKPIDREQEERKEEKRERLEDLMRLLPGREKATAKSQEEIEESQAKDWEAQAEYLAAHLYYLRPRAFPFDTIDMSAYAKAAVKRDSMSAKVAPGIGVVAPGGAGGIGGNGLPKNIVLGNGPGTNPVWTNLHPNQPESPAGYSNQTISWRVSGLTYDPNIPNRYYCSGSRGGVWQSDDRGLSWKPLIDSQPLIGASCVTVDVRDSNTIFVGTGEFDTGYPGIGVLKGKWDGTKWNFTAKGVAQFANAPIKHILQHPNVPSRFLATAANRGLFLSTDNGETWTEVLGPNKGGATGSFSNVISNSTATTLYACADGAGGGVWRSTDSGLTWTSAGAPSPGAKMDIACSPQTTYRGERTLYAVYSQEKTVYKMSPPGTKGNPPDDNDKGNPSFVASANFPKDPADTNPGQRSIWSQSTFYNLSIACTAIPANNSTARVRTTDDATPIPHFGTYTRDIIIVGMLNLHVSVDSGNLWRAASGDGLIDYPYTFDNNKGVYWAGIGSTVPNFHTDQHALAINPRNPLEFLAGSDGGAYRLTVTPNNEPGGPLGGLHHLIPEPIPAMPTRPDTPNTTPPPWFGSFKDKDLFVGPDNVFDYYLTPNYNDAPGPFRSAVFKPLADYTITSLNAGLGIAQFYTNAYHPTDPQIGLGGTQDNGTQYSFGSFTGWDNIFGGDGGAVGINQNNPGLQYASNYNPKVIDPNAPPIFGFARTTTGWNDRQLINLFVAGDLTPLAFILAGGVSKSNPNILYAGTNYLYKFDEATFPGSGVGIINQNDPFFGNPATYSLNWRKFRQLFSDRAYISSIATSPQPNTAQYLGVSTFDGTVWFSTNADMNPDPNGDPLVSFTRVDNQGAAGGLPPRSVGQLLISPSNPKRLFAVLQGTGASHVWRCDDATKVPFKWVDIGQGLPDISTNAIVVLPRNSDKEIAIGTDVGAFYTADGGTNWNNITVPLGLPNVQVNAMEFVPGTNFLNAATFGRGMWHIDLTKPLDAFSGGGGGGGGGPVVIPPVITIAPYFEGYVGSRTKLTMNVQVFQGATLVLNRNLPLSAAGYATITLPTTGVFDILISVPGFLHKRVAGGSYKVDTTIRPNLTNGDVNRDNAVTPLDLQQAQRKLGQYTTGPEDVDGDGSVTPKDISIISKNNGKVGDP